MLSQILDSFWKLASNSIEERIEAANFLTNECKKVETNKTTKVRSKASAPETASGSLGASSPLTRYCLKRLIAGLSSTRDSARQGFALGLSGIISILTEKVDYVNELAQYMDNKFSNKDGQEVIGHLFGLGAIVESGTGFSPASIQRLTNNLMEVYNAKSFVKEASIEVLIKLAYKIRGDNSLLKIYFSCPRLGQFLQVDPSEPMTPPEVLTLGIHLWPLMPRDFCVGCRLLPENSFPSIEFITDRFEKQSAFSTETSIASEKFFSNKHLEFISECLKMTTSSHPRMHSCWESMLYLLIPGYGSNRINHKINLVSLENFWNILVENSLFASSSHERKYLGILLFRAILPYLDESGTEILITQKFIKCLANNINRQTYLNRASVQAVELLADKLKKLGCSPSKILSRICEHAGNQLSHLFKNSGIKMETEKAGIPSEILESLNNSSERNALRIGHISKIPGIVKKHQNEPGAFQDLFKSLIDTYFTEEDNVSEESKDAGIKIIGSLLNSIGILSRSHSNIESLVNMEVNILEHLKIRLNQSSRSVKDSSKVLGSLRETVSDKVGKSDPKKIYHFLHLICLLELYSIFNPSTIDEEMTNDLENVFSKGLMASKKGGNSHEESIQWQDVLVDCILSVISRNEAPYPSAPLRDSGELLFRYFSADVSRNGLFSMFDVLVQSLDEAGAKDKESDDDDDLMDASDVEESDEMISVEQSDSEVEDLPELDMETDLPDATDEQMFKMDSMLGAYFASHANVKSKKQLREDSINFKLRVMSCLEIYMRLNPDSSLLLEAPDPLLSSLVSVSRPEGSQVLQERLAGLIKNKLSKCKCRELNPPDIEPESIRQQLRKALYLASRSPVKVVADSSVVAYMFLQRCLHHTEHLRHIADESLEACLNDYFTKKKSKLTKSFLPELFKKVPELAGISLPTLIQQCMTARSSYLRTEAFMTIGSIFQIMGAEEAKKVLKENEELTAEMLKSSSDLLGSGKRKEVQKVISKINALI